MEEIIRILMDRDSLSRAEAESFFEDCMLDVDWYLEQGDIFGAEECFEWAFGLEPDYFEALII